MKLFIILATIFTAALAEQTFLVDSDNFLKPHLENLDIEVPLELFEKLKLRHESPKFRDGTEVTDEVAVVLNELADKIFENIKKLLTSSSINSIVLPNTVLKLTPVELNLTSGVLEDISSISRHDDVVINYSTDTDIISLTLPLKFDDLKFSYAYHSKILFISSHGGLEGKIKNVKINAEISVHLDTYQIFLDHYDMKDTGDITIKFTGNSAVDWLTNAMTKVITVTLHSITVGEVQKTVKTYLQSIIDIINDAINVIFFPISNAEALRMLYYRVYGNYKNAGTYMSN